MAPTVNPKENQDTELNIEQDPYNAEDGAPTTGGRRLRFESDGAPVVPQLKLSQEIMSLHEARSSEADLQEQAEGRDRITSWIANVEEADPEPTDTPQFVTPVFQVTDHRSGPSSTGLHEAPFVSVTVDGVDEDDDDDDETVIENGLLATREKQRRASTMAMQNMMHTTEDGSKLEKNKMNKKGRYLGTQIDKNQALSRISIFDVQQRQSTSSLTLVKSAIMVAAQRTALGKTMDVFKGLKDKVKQPFEKDVTLLATTDPDKRQSSWRQLVTAIKTKEEEIGDAEVERVDSSPEEEPDMSDEETRLQDELNSLGTDDGESEKSKETSAPGAGINLKGLVNLRMMSKKAKNKASENSPKAYAISADHEKLIKKHGDDVRCDLPLSSKLQVYEFAIPVLQETIKMYKKKIGAAHPMTQEAVKQLEKMQHLTSEQGIFFRKPGDKETKL